jgi:hypothetical protein
MDDYAALVERVCFTLPKVKGCLLLSDDGLVLSAYPDDGDSVAETAWLRFCTLGEPLRGFLAFADEVWAYVRHGPYAAFVVAESGVRPGVLVDRLEQVLTTPRITLPVDTSHAPEVGSAVTQPPSVKPDPPRAVVAPPAEDPSATPLPEPAVVEGSWSPVRAADRADDEEGEIDRVQLAQEFSGLLQMHRADDEASS